MGLNPGDTVARYETLAGNRLIERANRVHLYSPRFGVVRQVVGFQANEQWEQAIGTQGQLGLAENQEKLLALASKQHYQLREQMGERRLLQAQASQGDGALSGAAGVRGFSDGFLPYENLRVIRTGQFDSQELALLAEGAAAAQYWSHTAVLQVFIDKKAAVATAGLTKVDVIYRIDEPPSNPRLRVIKLASRHHASPGEIVHFTIRFDNVGNEAIRNIVILDSLSTRLEYVENSAECSLPASFALEPNEAGSTVLRWEITDPLPPGQGGIIRFQCRVR
jgi:uncharacterized repeat protein (TIGR01451 family)